MDEIHLRDGTILDADTYDVIRTPQEAREEAGETHDWRICAARDYLTTKPGSTPDELQAENAELRRLLALAIDVANDWAVTDPESLDYVPVS